MFKTFMVLSALWVCCYCEQDSSLIDEGRAKKKKGVARLWIMIILFILSKVAVLKVVSMFLFMAFFQKFCYIIGLLISYFMKTKGSLKPSTPAAVYGAPADYNTIGYSYGPPENEPFTHTHAENSAGYPDLGNFNWPFKRN